MRMTITDIARLAIENELDEEEFCKSIAVLKEAADYIEEREININVLCQLLKKRGYVVSAKVIDWPSVEEVVSDMIANSFGYTDAELKARGLHPNELSTTVITNNVMARLEKSDREIGLHEVRETVYAVIDGLYPRKEA